MASLKELLSSYYEMFSRMLSGHSCKITTELDNFLSIVSEKEDLSSLGEWFAWWYVAFQFEYYGRMKTRFDGKIPASWIFGKKAYKRWQERGSRDWMYFVSEFLYKAEIDTPFEFFGKDCGDMFEEERKRYLNTDRGLLHCLQFARYSEKSATCIICRDKKDCMLLWK